MLYWIFALDVVLRLNKTMRTFVSTATPRVVISIMLLAGLGTSCSNRVPSAITPVPADLDVAVLAVVTTPGLALPVSLAVLEEDMLALLERRTRGRVVSAMSVRETIGSAPHDELKSFYARNGRLAAHQVQRLMAANIAASHALIARVESDLTEQLLIINNKGGATRRTTQLSADMLDLRTGRLVWTRQYRVSPATVSPIDPVAGKYAKANPQSMINENPRTSGAVVFPSAPPLAVSLRALLLEVASSVPIR